MRIKSFVIFRITACMWQKKSSQGSRELFHTKLGDKVDTEEPPLHVTTMNKPVLLAVKRKGEKIDQERVWKLNGKRR